MSDLPVGPTLDLAVAQALGDKVCRGPRPWWDCKDCDAAWERGAPIDHTLPEPYSTSWEAAGRVLESLEARGWHWTAWGRSSAEGHYSVQLVGPLVDDKSRRLCQWGATLPEAVCRATLIALEFLDD